jgi:cation diffusion facilitator CzcD-associated flavoprotein CzcO
MAASPPQVLVIGGGIGGLCLAHGLKKAGIHLAIPAAPHGRARVLPPLWRYATVTSGHLLNRRENPW